MSRSDPPTVLESLARAVHSDDLSHRTTLCDVDFVHGLGMAGQQQAQGTALLDLHMTLDRAAAADALNASMQIVREVAKRRGWPMTPLRARKIAGESLAMYLRPTCTPCKGRGALGLDRDKPEQAERVRPCPTCGGSGKRPPPLKHRREIVEVLYVMETRLQSALSAVRRAMSSRAHLE